MNSIESIAYARAGLLGNPSDGYNGRTIAFTVRNFYASVRISPADQLVFIPGQNERHSFEAIDEFVEQMESNGYYGGIRLLKAAIVQFVHYGRSRGWAFEKPFQIGYFSDIPRQVGLAGSSAIVVATLKGLCQWFDVSIDRHILATLAWRAEAALGIVAGLQDRVIQSYEGLVYMNFEQDVMKCENGVEFGQYEPIPPDLLSNLYIAYAADVPESTEVLHNDLRQKYDSGDLLVIKTLNELADLADKGKSAIQSRNVDELARLINLNFDLRMRICKLHPEHVKMVNVARQCGASAKYCGSGGAIVGTYRDKSMLEELEYSLTKCGCSVLLPEIIAPETT